jgi:hypothetical protein
MPGPEFPDALPPEVPEEFADAYREAYRRALEAQQPVAAPEVPEVPAQEVVLVGTHRAEVATPERERAAWRTSRWFLPVAAAASALVLVLAAYAVGNALSGDDGGGGTHPSAAHSTRPTHPADKGSRSPDAKPSRSAPTKLPGAWTGQVTEVAPAAISADCTAGPSRDSAGQKVTYVPEKAIDGKAQTAWRCSGTAIGEKLTIRLGGDANVAEVGLIPGYAKTDPESGQDRYAENNRITRVRWTLGDGVSFVQKLDPDPSSRAIQLIRVPPTVTDTITLEITAVKRGPRTTTAISEIAVLKTA